MDPSFFGLDGHPFESSSEEDAVHLADAHASLIAELRAGLKAPHGITLLIGEPGSGKSQLMRRFAHELTDHCTVAYLPTTGPGLRHLLTEIIEQLGGSPPIAAEEPALLEALSSLARARAEHGRTTLVVIDDAHELPAKTIERVGRLFGDDPAEPSMLHVVLVGRPELLDRMNAANDRTILKHLVQVCRMDPIGPEESFRYIADRVANVGGEVDQLFTQDALRMIVKRANGNPRRIDTICSAALRQAEQIGERAIGADTVDLACLGVEGFRTDGIAETRDDEDPMEYIFGDDEGDRRGGDVTRRMLGQTNGSNEPWNSTTRAPERSHAPGARGLAMVVDKLREQLAAGDNRRRLLVWAVGLVAVLIGFVSVTSRTGEQAGVAPSEQTDIAAVAKDKEHATEGVAAQKPGQQPVALPSSALRSGHLVVKREGDASGTAPPVQPKVEAAAATPQSGTETPGAKAPAVDDKPAKSVALPGPAAWVEPPPAPAAPSTAPAPPPQAAGTPGSAPVTPKPAESPPPAPAASTPAVAPVVATVPKPAQPQQPVTGANAPAAQAPHAPAALSPAAASASASPQPVASAPKPQAAPAPAAAPEAAVAKASKPEAPAAVKAASGAPAPAGAKYTVQLGAFKSRENAEALLSRVQKSYPDGRVLPSEGGGPAVFRVVSGAFATKTDAASRAKTLAASGYSAYVRDMPR